jgi:hypothetical protein
MNLIAISILETCMKGKKFNNWHDFLENIYKRTGMWQLKTYNWTIMKRMMKFSYFQREAWAPLLRDRGTNYSSSTFLHGSYAFSKSGSKARTTYNLH